MKYAPPIGQEAQGENAHYIDGNPELGILGSPVPAAALEPGQRELVHVIRQAGLTPSAEDLTQLYQAICKIIGAQVPLATDENVGLVKPDGTTLTVDEDGVLSVIQKADATVARLEELRKLSIGAPRFHRSAALPANHAWPDGSLVEFEDWPELAEVYEQGGFTGMLLPWDADAETQAANLGKFRPNAANPTGLYLPLHGGQFFRNWTLGQGADAGAWGEDQMQRLTGGFYRESAPNQGFLLDYQLVASGVFGFTAGPTQDSQSKFSGVDESRAWAYAPIDFDSARVARSGTETVPSHIRQPVIIYLGRPR